MAQKFGGQFSPDGTGPTAPRISPLSGKQPAKGRTRANLLFLMALPILFTSIGDGARDMAVAIGAFALMALGAWLTR